MLLCSYFILLYFPQVFEGLFAGSVPVYRGSSTVHKFMPSNSSFINANDLSPKQLAELLKKIAADEREYNQYLAFKKDPLPTSFEEIALLSYVHPNVLCRLCDYAVSTTMK